MSLVGFYKGTEANIKALKGSSSVREGTVYVATDTGTMWLGTSATTLLQVKDNINTTYSSIGSFDIADALDLDEYKYYGIKIDKNISDPAAACTYIGDAEGMETGWAAWENTPIFQNIKPCVLKDGIVQYYLQKNNMSLKEDGSAATTNSVSAGDVMIEVPKVGYAMSSDTNYLYIWLTDDPSADGYCYAAHSKDIEGDCDKIYYSAFEGCVADSKMYSISGVSPTVNISLTDARKYAEARGDGYELFSFYPLTLLQCMFLMIYKNRNGQAALGNGVVATSAKVNTGGTLSQAFNYGSTANSSTQVKFLGVEDFFGNVWDWVDGFYCDGGVSICTYYKNFAGTDNGSNYQYILPRGNRLGWNQWIKDVMGTNHGGFTPYKGGGSETTYWSDNGYLVSSRCALFGGSWCHGSYAGPFRLGVNYAASSSFSDFGARLAFRHQKS